jgi:hypothetical protein
MIENKQMDWKRLLITDDYKVDLEFGNRRGVEAVIVVASDSNVVGAFTLGISQRARTIGWT